LLRYTTGEKMAGIMIHDLMFNELVVESLYRPMLKLQSDKIAKIPGSHTRNTKFMFK